MITPAPEAAHHELAAHEVVLLLESDPHRGLSEGEAAQRLLRFGPNALPGTETAGPVRRMLRQFHHPLIYVLLASGALTVGLGEYVDAAVILGVVVVNAVVGYLQETKAEAALEGLRSMLRTRVTVVREGRRHRVDSADLVPGDLVQLEAGDKVPADLRLARSAELRVNESALTGESAPVRKHDGVLSGALPVADRRNMVYSGTLVTTGTGAGIVVATGTTTELGEIHRLVGAAHTLATPLTRKLAEFSRILTAGILALAAATFAVGLLRGQDTQETFVAAIALAVAVIPEGLPAVVTVTLAIGVARMARRHAVIRRLPAVETLGSTTVICSDKTGTLTENRMTVTAVWTPTRRYEVTGSGGTPLGGLRTGDGAPVGADDDRALRWSLLAGAACNDAALTERDGRWQLVGDPTEGAMLMVAAKVGLFPGEVRRQWPRAAVIPFSSERQYMATLHADGAGGHVVLAKGSVERMLELCGAQLDSAGHREPLDREATLRAATDLAGEGLRVLATAVRSDATTRAFAEDALPGTLVLTGLQAMHDPPRAAARSAIEACRSAGITVKMITGDHAVTAAAVAERVGLLDAPGPGAVLTGAELAALPAGDLLAAVRRASVFARVSPEQKLRLVEALQAAGEVVAMTGDGVNDAPALRQAGVGVAMGRGGTEVAKDAADMVLTDDDFATIEAAVEEGRGVFDNLTKFITWTLPTNVGQGLVVLVAILLGLTLPILPTQILWINLTTAVFLGLALAFEPKEPGIMARPPRTPDAPLLTRAVVVRIALVSTLLVAGAWWLFEWELSRGASLPEARTAAVNLFVVVETCYLLSCRSLRRSAWRTGLFTNRWVVAGIAAQAAAQLAFTYLPVMNTIFDTAPIGPDAWLRIGALAAVASAVVALDKRKGM
ncbi:HAD-IC family P-type ATPase [Nocardia puris]|uniref:Cation-transporting ATPase F n=2 Tax=Nocardia TaxID=1817 RepID=A0A366E0X2_9NOCA|nr:HAD-IC family P-type ATPase [Nocardia puris]RBO96020.1 cation-transporting ATPase F [Nocardia puris]